jgi:hypothetical protein
MLSVKIEDELERVKKVGVGKVLAGIRRRPLNIILGGKGIEDTMHAELAFV